MTASAYERPFAEPKGCISERQQPANSGSSDNQVFWELASDDLMRDQGVVGHVTPVGPSCAARRDKQRDSGFLYFAIRLISSIRETVSLGSSSKTRCNSFIFYSTKSRLDTNLTHIFF